ncbi:uncharacterized protein PHALS_03582 [Plasmopara halstedii]|uniref:Uncharacterized protein n=1 Tax=Plasmopara halstedii TaxID=4781 RepID=A0A0P1AZW2_PLAHL|nr:uncharacterized protein PHALS_03582 [Plasmopara halstedii]CEG46911.1 hypothetical protein PHALS_03582 [Plasmopara halstedii]|eukprot:XP_024583280.1 hypothetical protein PHALS_03582 [Plasmopara halstedii]
MTISGDRTATKQVFAKLEQLLIQTADDAVYRLQGLKGNLSEFDSRHKLFLVNTSKFNLRSDIRTTKDSTSELRAAANQIADCKKPTESEITAARSAMHATVDALNDLARSAREFDKKGHKVKGVRGVVAGLFGSNQKSTEKPKESIYDDPVDVDNHRVGSDGILRAPNTAEEVVASTLGDCFSGFKSLQHQIAIAEKALSPMFAGQINELI